MAWTDSKNYHYEFVKCSVKDVIDYNIIPSKLGIRIRSVVKVGEHIYPAFKEKEQWYYVLLKSKGVLSNVVG